LIGQTEHNYYEFTADQAGTFSFDGLKAPKGSGSVTPDTYINFGILSAVPTKAFGNIPAGDFLANSVQTPPNSTNLGSFAVTSGETFYVAVAHIGSNAKFTADYSFTPVPEPATWTLMLAGVGGIGLAMRRRAKQAAIAA
jgi:hypothetical protein